MTIDVSELTDDFLQHYGKKGMKWGVKKAAYHLTADHETTLNNYSSKRSDEIRDARKKAPEVNAAAKKAKTNYKDQKKKYKANKKAIGRKEANKILEKRGREPLRKALEAQYKNREVATRKTGSEAASAYMTKLLVSAR